MPPAPPGPDISRPDDVPARRRTLAPLLVVTVALAAAVTLTGLLLHRSDDDAAQVADSRPSAAATAGPTTRSTPPASVPPTIPSRAARPTTAASSPVGSTPATSSPREQEPFWTVITASLTEEQGGERAARQFAARLTGLGYGAAVFPSTDYASMNPGYWVVSSGRFSGRSAASSLAVTLHNAGFDIAYPRCAGTYTQCA